MIEEVQLLQRERSRHIGAEGLEHRLYALSQIKRLLTEHEEEWLAALKADLHKHPVEAYASEISVLLNEIAHIEKMLPSWLKPLSKERRLLSGRDKVVTVRKPYGSVLVIAPWNYPLQLALMPAIGALAGGNGVVLKPSESAPATSQLLQQLVPAYFPKKVFHVVTGDRDVGEKLTSLQWDFIFFTGSPETGQKVYEAAARHLTPVLLELGGKNPCIIEQSGLSKTAIKKIIWGKFLNAGQSCIAPDTVYVPREQLETVLEMMKEQISAFYGENPLLSESYGRIVHKDHYDKIMTFMADGRVYYGGDASADDGYIGPTLLVDVIPGSPICTEEIFGPVLPVVPYDSVADVIQTLQTSPVPLCTYIFSNNLETQSKIADEVQSGAVSINEVMLHAVNPFLAFGGNGKSGLGKYHGEASFEAFTHPRPVYSKQTPFLLSKQFPPYSKATLLALRKLRRKIF